jgi:hypothetical protein
MKKSVRILNFERRHLTWLAMVPGLGDREIVAFAIAGRATGHNPGVRVKLRKARLRFRRAVGLQAIV